MSETRWTKRPWLREGATVYALDWVPGMYVQGHQAEANRMYFQVETSMQLASKNEIEAVATLAQHAPDLYDAAALACEMFERKNHSTAESDWMGDDEHEAWSALRKAMRKARGESETV